MTDEHHHQPTIDAIQRARAEIASLADWLELELHKHDAQPATWAMVNSLESVRDQLLGTLAFFSGIDETQIQRSLDELHS